MQAKANKKKKLLSNKKFYYPHRSALFGGITTDICNWYRAWDCHRKFFEYGVEGGIYLSHSAKASYPTIFGGGVLFFIKKSTPFSGEIAIAISISPFLPRKKHILHSKKTGIFPLNIVR
jgi:hypothetical protein